MKKSLKKQSLTIIKFILCCILIIGTYGVKANAEEAAIDATSETPYSYNVESGKTGSIIPISFSKAGVYTYKIEVTGFADTVHVDFLKKAEATSADDIASFTSFNGTEKEFTKVIKEPINYYLFVYSENPPAGAKTIKVTCTYNVPETEGKSVKADEEVKAVSMDGLYYSIKLKKDSKITVSGDKVSLCDSKKEFLTSVPSDGDSVSTYLKKGTYYIKTSAGIEKFKYTINNTSTDKNVTQKKAKKIKVGKNVKMKLYASNGTKGALYYKVTLKKAKKISVTADSSKLLSDMNVEIYKKKAGKVPYLSGYKEYGKKGKISFNGQTNKSIDSLLMEKKTVKLPAGTYYIMVSSTSGGDATIKIK